MRFVEILPLNPHFEPHPRSGHRAVATDSDLWIWGGYHPPIDDDDLSHIYEELWRFNFARQQWTHEHTTGDAPRRTVASPAVCLYRHFLFVFGGTGYPFGRRMSNDLFILNLRTLNWKKYVIEGMKPNAVYGASIVMNGDHLYILCGTNSNTYNTDVFDVYLPTMTSEQIGFTFVETVGFDNSGRYRQEIHLHNNQIFLFGGSSFQGVPFGFDWIPVFDIKLRKWLFINTNPDPIHNFPLARKFHSVVPFHKNQVLMFGGAQYDQGTFSHTMTDEKVWCFDFDRHIWTLLQNVKLVRSIYFHATAINDRGEVWIHGGIVDDVDSLGNPKRISTLYQMQSRVLKLSEITWNCFLHNFRDRENLLEKKEVLSRFHVPQLFIERIH